MSYVIWLRWAACSLNSRADITLCLCWWGREGDKRVSRYREGPEG